MSAKIVIGANFGDEGKGLTTDFLSSQDDDTIVVRFNGGGQAGHTVQTLIGRTHIFHHFGSGTLADCATFLSQHFVVNPTMFVLEHGELLQMGCNARVYLDVRAPLTTPYDMMINWLIEEERGNARHGSCGFGINETIHRNERGSQTVTDFITHAADLLHPNELRNKLVAIRDFYMPFRLKQLKCSVTPDSKELSDDIIDKYLADCEFLVDKCTLKPDAEVLKGYNTIVFEGAQGLLLDELHRWFPHVTRSRTGVHNAVEVLKEIDVKEAEVFYVTRGYLTRHGAGPLPFEVPSKIYEKIVDTTNINNQFQGGLRFAPLNLDLLKESITNDLKTVSDFTLFPNLVITCLNQLPEQVRYVKSNIILENDVPTFLQAVKGVYKFHTVYQSNGPTRFAFSKS